ncbi:hypothetical protein HIM_06485 [Hirsutella minnesotensis 3608]|uniref:Protein FAF1 n=1 Tax=Hirsutella minnesotensis 3608 TaxID=1043627 RepID=A0A0F7ZIW6_9HYPO|nr:hypothetical protein HIM_06485 [Hirsutella minnesotensis 3608]
MAVLGKRKAPAPPPAPETDALEIFRRHFESRFEPLQVDGSSGAQRGLRDGSDDDDDDAASPGQDEEWGGLSDDQGAEEDQAAAAVEVVDHSSSQTSSAAAAMSRSEFKAFMSSRPPDRAAGAQVAAPAKTNSSSSALPEDAPSLLAQDLELRRLLAESHLLAPRASASLSVSSSDQAATPKAFASGRTRQKATDMRIQALGSKLSILKQEKMPMHMRKGIVAAAASRESKRRREARENGVILEREVGKKRRRERTRETAVDRPGVGRLKGAELRISERDVKKIEGGRDTFGRRGAKR